MTIEISGILIISLSFIYWLSAQSVKEIAYHSVREHCRRLQLQMLDDYVALQQLRLKRSSTGKLCIMRSYGFEFSVSGIERYQGQIILMGRKIETIRTDAYRILDYACENHP